MAISGLINNIASSIKGLGASLGLGKAESSPNYIPYKTAGIESIDSSTKERWFNYVTDRYVFGIINDGDTLALESEGTKAVKSITSFFSKEENLSGKKGEGPDASKFSDFKLPITPQEITQVEDFATTIRPTQGGTVVHHSGNRYKDLTISGTTGVHPFRGSTGVNRLNGAAIFQPDELKYRSGYEVFIHFRNWIKSYVEAKAQGGKASSMRMIFKNFKDWEFLIVEPVKFTMKRDASKPLLYNYSIQFRVLGHYFLPEVTSSWLDTIDKALNVAKASMEISRGIFMKFQEVIRSTAGEVDGVIENMRLMGLAVKAAKGIGITMSDISTRIDTNYVSQRDALALMLKIGAEVKNLRSVRAAESAGTDLETTPEDPDAFSRDLRATVLKKGTSSPKDNFLKAKNSLGNFANSLAIDSYPAAAKKEILKEQEAAALISRERVENIRNQIENLKNRFIDATGLGDSTYEGIFGLIAVGDQSPESENTDSEFEILYGFKSAIEGIDSLLSTDEMFDINAQLYSKADSNSGADTIGQGIFSFPDPNAGVREGIVPVGATLEDIAFVELGNSSRWTELADLNGLKAPYIDNSQSSGKKVNYTVKSANFSDPSDIQGLVVGSYYLVAILPTPTGGWLGKADKLAQYQGSDQTQTENWRFIAPPIGTVANVIDREEYREYTEAGWVELEIEEIASTEVLRPGDVIRIPSSGNTAPRSFTRGPRDNPIVNGLSSSEKSLGVDLKITEEGDLLLTSSGDFAAASGSENGAQAIVLKLLYEKGELKKHKEIGTQLKVGGKVPSAAAIRSQVATSLLQDERIRDVKNINIRQVNSSLEVSFDVFFREVQEPIPIVIPI